MSKSQIIEGTDIMFGVPAVSHYGNYPQGPRSHSAGSKAAGSTTGRLNSKEDRHCYACGEKGHYARDKQCKRDNIRRFQETRVRYGDCEVTDAFAVLEDMDEHCGTAYSSDNGSKESDFVIRSSTDETNYVVAAHPENAAEAMEIARVDAYMARQFSLGETGADFH
jgi:Zinc knuckle